MTLKAIVLPYESDKIIPRNNIFIFELRLSLPVTCLEDGPMLLYTERTILNSSQL